MKKFLSRFSKRAKLVVVGAVVALTGAVVIPAAVKAGFGPDRETKVYSQGVPGFDHVTFNSFTNVPNIGDERQFFNGKYPNAAAYSDPMPEVKDGDVLTLEVYVHNGADSALNDIAGQPGVAKNTKVRVALPTTIAKSQQATAYISADNAVPTEVYDTLDLGAANGGMFQVEYVPGSAHIQGNHINSAISDSVVTTGATIGSESLNGDVRGCFDEVTYVTIQVKVKMPRYSLEKEVRAAGTSQWGETLNVKAGDTTEWISTFSNTGDTVLKSVNFIDQVPAGMTVVPGSVKLINGNYPNGYVYTANAVQDNGRTINVDIGDYNPGAPGVAYVMYQTKIDPIAADQCSNKTLVNKAFATPEGFGAIWDDANVVVAGNVCQPNQPVYTCDLFDLTTGGNRTVTASNFKYTATNGATFKHAVINWGDNSAQLTTNNVVGQTHQFAKDGTYTVRTTAFFTVNGQEVSANGANCAKTVTFTNGVPVTPPTTLVNTGAGDVLGIFAAVTVAGAMAHRLVLARRIG
jgi:uncharacterized repeat protein (TIGR01451 family)